MSQADVLTRILGHPAASGFAGGLAGGMLTSKSGRKLAKKALKLGGVAAVGGLAYAAWQRSQAASPAAASANGPVATTPVAVPAATSAAPAALPERFVPRAGSADTEALGRTLVEAMIAAANADGRLDGEERRAIFERIAGLDLGPADQSELYAQLEQPADLERLASAARTREQAIEIYTASVLAVEVDTAAERGYLQLLAARLGLDDALVSAIHAEVQDARAA